MIDDVFGLEDTIGPSGDVALQVLSSIRAVSPWDITLFPRGASGLSVARAKQPVKRATHLVTNLQTIASAFLKILFVYIL